MSTLRVVPDQPARLTDRVAAEVRANMARVRMTQTELAEILGLTQSTVSKRLLGKIAFSVDELETAADALGVHPAVLMGGVPQPATNGPRGGGSPTPWKSPQPVTDGEDLTMQLLQPAWASGVAA